MPSVLAGLFLLLAGSASAASPWPPSAKLRAQALVAQMTLAEKLSLCMGSEQGTYAGTLPAIPRLGIPEFTLEDGPQGVGDGMSGVTAFPTALTVAQSWDPALLQSFGAAVGLEHFLKGTNVMLGPGTNLARNPFNGRLWEYYGESEVLSAAAVAAFVTGAQSNNVSTCVKHYLCNSQEFNRNSEDAVVGQRPLRELYAHAYRAAAAAGAGSFMLGVNKVNGLENSASPETLDILFNDGFEGWFVTDWAGIMVPNASAAALAGTSVEMPRGYQYQYLPAFIANGTLPVAVIDGLVTRVLTAAAALGLLDTPASPARGPAATATSPQHTALARTLAARGTVLLKNAGGLLPLDPASPALAKGILVLGDEGTVTGCGSGNVRTPAALTTPYQGLLAALNANASRPVKCTVYQDTDFFQDGAPCVSVSSNGSALPSALTDACCALCTAQGGCTAWTVVPGALCPGQPAPAPGTPGQCFLKPDTSGQRPHPGIASGVCAPYPPTTPPLLYFPEALGEPAVAADLAKAFSAVLIVAALPVQEPEPGCEGQDRATLALPPQYDALIAAVAAANPSTIVVTRTGGAALMPWLSAVPAVLHTGLAGQEAGGALADVLLGAVNPAGKLTLSFPATDTAHWLQSRQQYPGVFNATGDGFWHTNYSEGMQVGYRFYQLNPATPPPLFPFGHGLSYSTFAYSNLSLSAAPLNSSATPTSPASSVSLSLTVTNTAGPPGRDTVQLYLAGPLPGDAMALKAFAGTGLLPSGAAAQVTLQLGPQDVQYWQEGAGGVGGGWQGYGTGSYAFAVGASSQDWRLRGQLSIVQ